VGGTFFSSGFLSFCSSALLIGSPHCKRSFTSEDLPKKDFCRTAKLSNKPQKELDYTADG
jgi:hypothetical protein